MARGALGARLPAAAARLVELVDVSNFLACETVVRRQRAAGRLVVSTERVDDVLAAMRGHGLHAERSPYDMLARRELVDGTHHAGGLVRRGSEPDAEPMVYFACRADLLPDLPETELRNAHDLLGRAFGYPDCCVEQYARNGHGGPHDRTATTVDDGGDEPHPRQLNPLVAPLFGIDLLWHFPCSMACAASRALFAERVRLLVELAPETEGVEALGAGIALYGPKVGIALATGYEQLGERRYRLTRVLTRSPVTRSLFADLDDPVLDVDSAHRFRLGDRLFDDPRGFVALFR